jgi:hypothetical protein
LKHSSTDTLSLYAVLPSHLSPFIFSVLFGCAL